MPCNANVLPHSGKGRTRAGLKTKGPHSETGMRPYSLSSSSLDGIMRCTMDSAKITADSPNSKVSSPFFRDTDNIQYFSYDISRNDSYTDAEWKGNQKYECAKSIMYPAFHFYQSLFHQEPMKKPTTNGHKAVPELRSCRVFTGPKRTYKVHSIAIIIPSRPNSQLTQAVWKKTSIRRTVAASAETVRYPGM